jgi:hypothetical protein
MSYEFLDTEKAKRFLFAPRRVSMLGLACPGRDASGSDIHSENVGRIDRDRSNPLMCRRTSHTRDIRQPRDYWFLDYDFVYNPGPRSDSACASNSADTAGYSPRSECLDTDR